MVLTKVVLGKAPGLKNSSLKDDGDVKTTHQGSPSVIQHVPPSPRHFFQQVVGDFYYVGFYDVHVGLRWAGPPGLFLVKS